MKKNSTKKNGFSLFEVILSVALVSLLLNGLFAAWYIAETRQRGLEDYWEAKETLETAFETTHRILREKADGSQPINILLGGQGIEFTDINDGSVWQFYVTDGTSYKQVHNGEKVLLDNCNYINFNKVDARSIEITLGVSKPSTWAGGADDLRIHGRVYVRNPHL